MVVEATSGIAICILYPVSKNPIMLLLNSICDERVLGDFAYCAELIVTLYILTHVMSVLVTKASRIQKMNILFGCS